MEKVSVIIPTYNRAGKILRSLQSVLDQTYAADEVIIVDDHSTDDTLEVLSAVKDDRIKVVPLAENKGAGGARNVGVKEASNEWIAFQDSDDLWLPEKLEKQMAYYKQNPECGLVYTAYTMRIQPIDLLRTVPPTDGSCKVEGEIFENLLYRNTVGAPTVLMKKSVFEEIGGFDESMQSLEDWDFALKVAQKYPIGFVPQPLLFVEQLANGVSSNVANYYQNRCYMIQKYRSEYLARNLLSKTLQSILEGAQRDGVLPLVEKMLTLYLSV